MLGGRQKGWAKSQFTISHRIISFLSHLMLLSADRSHQEMLFQVTRGTLSILWEESHRRKAERLAARATAANLSPGGTGKCALSSSPKTYQTGGFVASERIQHAHLIHGTFIFVFGSSVSGTHVFMAAIFYFPLTLICICIFVYECVCIIYIYMCVYMGFPHSSAVKSPPPPRQCRRCGFNPWVGKIPWRRKWQPTPVFLPGKSHGQRRLAGYGLWGSQKSGMTEQLNHLHHGSIWRSSIQ